MNTDQDKILTALAQMMTKVDQRFDQITAHIDKKHDDAMTKMDSVYKELITVPQEQSIHLSQHDDINTRLTTIENTPTIAHELRTKP